MRKINNKMSIKHSQLKLSFPEAFFDPGEYN